MSSKTIVIAFYVCRTYSIKVYRFYECYFFPDVKMYIHVKVYAHEMVMQHEVCCNFCKLMMYDTYLEQIADKH